MTDDPNKPALEESDCLEAFDYLYSYLNGELNNQQSLDKLEHHLSHCKSCYSRAQMEKELNERMKKSAQNTTPQSLRKRLHKLIDDL